MDHGLIYQKNEEFPAIKVVNFQDKKVNDLTVYNRQILAFIKTKRLNEFIIGS